LSVRRQVRIALFPELEGENLKPDEYCFPRNSMLDIYLKPGKLVLCFGGEHVITAFHHLFNSIEDLVKVERRRLNGQYYAR
jgi:hypothetical protein